MNQLTLNWTEAGQSHTQTLNDQKTYRVGRDPTRCDIVLSHPTVSGLHIEIFFHPVNHKFYLKNLRETNPPMINNQKLITDEVILFSGNNIQLGQQELEVIAIAFEPFSITPTLLFSPDELTQKVHVLPNPVQYGLQCPKCAHVSSYEQLNIGCPWCGTSLAAAVSVVLSTQ